MIKQKCRAIFLLILTALFLMPGIISCSKSDGNEGKGKENKKAEESVNFALDPFIVNLNTPSGTGFLRASLQLELSNLALAEKAKTKTAHLRDAIVAVLSTKTPEELMTMEGKQQCKDEIALIANQALGEGSVKNVYFTDFVMQ